MRPLLTLAIAAMAFYYVLPANAEEAGDPYPLATCPVSGHELGAMGEPIVKDYEGREVRFCCEACVEPFEAEQEKHLEKLDEKLAKQQKPWYPLETCVVSGQELGSMGDPVTYVYNNRLFRFCCEGCVTAVKMDPAKYMERLDTSVVKAQSEGYPLETCVVSGHELGAMGEPVDVVVANKLIRLCCKACMGQIEDEPAKYLAVVEEAQDAAADE